MRRAIVVVAAAALLGGGCARSDLPPKAATRLQNQVTWIRRAVEAGAPRTALARLETLTATVDQLLSAGRIDRTRALDILNAVDDVKTQLALLPVRPAQTTSSSPSPSESQGNHGEGNNGNGKGNGDED